MDGATPFDVEAFVSGNTAEKHRPNKKPQGTATKTKVYDAASRARQLGYDVPNALADDFYNLTSLESGHSHFNKNGQVKLSPVDPKDGQAAVGYSQIKPGTIRKWGKLNPYDENDNILGGLLEFSSIDKNDPVARRIGYFAGEHSDALKYYRRTGKIPPGGDFTGTSFKKYIDGTGAGKADSQSEPFDAEKFVMGDTQPAPHELNFDVASFVVGDNPDNADKTAQAMPSDEPQSDFDVEGFVNSSPNNVMAESAATSKPQLDPLTGKVVPAQTNQTTPVTQTINTPLANTPAPAPFPIAPPITAPPDPTAEEADPRLIQYAPNLRQLAPNLPATANTQATRPNLAKSGSQGRQTPNLPASQPNNAALSDSQITPEQRAAAEADLSQANQAYNVLNAPPAQPRANANNPISVEQGANNKLGTATQVDISKVNLTGDRLKEYVYRRGLEQIAPNYNFSPSEVDAFVEEGRKGGFFNDAQFNADLKAARAKGGDLKSHITIPAWQIKQVLDNRRESEQIANEQAARAEVNQQTNQNANSLTGRVLNAADKGLQKGYEYLNPLNAVRDIQSGEFNKADAPQEVAARQRQAIYGNSSALDGQATQYLKNQEEARNMGNIEYGANIASSAAQVPADLFSSTVLTPAAIAQTAIERAAGKDTTVGDTFLGQASEALKKSYADNFKVHAGVQNDLAVSGVRKLGNLAGTLAIGLLPGGQALTSAAFGGQTATSFYEDAKAHGAPENVRLVSAGLGAVLGTAQGSVFSKMFGGLSNEAKAGFIKEFADSMRASMGKESANGLIKAASAAAEQSAPSAIGQIAKNALEGGAATGGTTLAQNLTAQNLYDPNRKATSGVAESALEGAAIGGGLTALSRGGQAVNEIRNAEPIKRAVDGVSELYKSTQIKPNLENLQDKLADLYDRADEANVSLPADKIITELQPELDKLPRKVQNEMIAAIQAGDAEAQATARPVLGLPESAPTNVNPTTNSSPQPPVKTTSPREGAAVEKPNTTEALLPQVATGESVPADADVPAGNVKPVTETPETLTKQGEAVANPESDKVAVLYTDPTTAPPADSQTYRVRTDKGLVIANQEKVATKFGIHDGKTFVDFVRSNPDAVSQLLGKKSDSYDPNNPVALTLDKNKNELSATNITTPEEANSAFAKDKADFPNDAASHQITSTQDVINARENGNSQLDSPNTKAAPVQVVSTERGTRANVTPRVVDAKDLLTSLDEGYPQEFQPRDRSRTASKAQISDIASKLNPAFLADSPKASDGRPLVIPVKVKGQTKFAVISGNGRSAAIKEAYNAGSDKSEEYADFARGKDNSGNHSQPVYVGELDPNQVDLHSFAREANELATAQMSATEQAKADAEKLSTGLMSSFVPSDDGSIHAAANRDFVRGFLGQVAGKTDIGRLTMPDGSLSQEGVSRVRNAIFAKAFGDSPEGLNAVQRMAESTDNNIKRITTAFLQSAGKFAELKQAIADGTRFKGLDITDDLSRAMEKFAALRDKGTTVDEYLAQQTMFGDDLSPFQKRLVQFLDANKSSAKKINGVFDNYITIANEAGNPNQTDLFGDSPKISGESFFNAAVTNYESGNRTTDNAEQVNLFDSNSGREARPENDSNRDDAASASESTPASRTEDGTDARGTDAQRLEPNQPTDDVAQEPNVHQAGEKPQPGALVTVDGKPAEVVSTTYGKVRVKFKGQAGTKLVNISQISPSEPSVSYAQSTGEAKIHRQLVSLRDKKQPTELLAQAAKFHPSANGKMVFANPEAVEILRRATTIAEGKEAPVWFGMYAKPSSMVKIGHALMKMRSDLPVGDSRKAITELLRTIGNDRYAETGLPIIAASRDFSPINSVTIQEELAHQADFMTRGRIAAKHVLKSSAARRLARKVKETYGNISNEAAAREVIAKTFRDDAGKELSASRQDLNAVKDEYIKALMQQGVERSKLIDAFEEVSNTGKEFIANYVKTGANSRPRRSDGGIDADGAEAIYSPIRGGREIRDGSTSGGVDRQDRLDRRSGIDTRRVSNEGLRDDAAEPKVTALVRIPIGERLRLERSFKGNPQMMQAAAEEVLMSRPPKAEPKTAIGKLVSKAMRGTTDLMTAPQSLITSFDLSSALRQGDILTLSEPRLAAIAFVRQLNALRQKGFDDFVDNLTKHPYISLAEHSNLYLSTLADSHSLGGREEAFMSRLLGDDPLFKNKIAESIRKLATLHVRASERAYKTYLDSIRMDAFAKFAREVHEYNTRKGQPDTDEQYAAVASFINKATGRGTLGGLEDAAPLLNSFFFSPRYWASRVQLLNPAFYAKLPAGVRGGAIKRMLMFAGATAGVMSLMKAAGAEISFDPNNPDFLKVRLGNYHFDGGAGFIQNVRYAAQMLELAKQRLIDGKAPGFGERNEIDLTTRLLRSKLAPAPGSLINLYTGKDFSGQPVTLKSELANSVTPLVINDMAKAIQQDGALGAALMLPSVFGVGVSLYDKDAKKTDANSSANPKIKEMSDDFVKRGQAGADIKPEVLEKLKYGELTRAQAKKILKDAAMPAQDKEAEDLKHGNLEKDIEDLKKLPAERQRELLPVLLKRIKKATPVQREMIADIRRNIALVK